MIPELTFEYLVPEKHYWDTHSRKEIRFSHLSQTGMAVFYEKGKYNMQDCFAVKDLRFIVDLHDSSCEREHIYVVSQPYSGGRWNKLCKSQERWWYTKEEAQHWLDSQEDWFKASNKVFKLLINIEEIERC